jgi:mitochondrial chaperone BCS1
MLQTLLELYKSYSAFTASNQFLGAAVAAAGLGAATWLIRDVPRKIYNLVWKSCTVSLELHYDDLYHNRKVFIHLSNWLADHSLQLLSRTFTLSLGTKEWSKRESAKDFVTATGGSGNHVVWYENKLYWYRIDKDSSSASSVTKQNLTLRTFGFNTLKLKKLTTDLFKEPDDTHLKVMSRVGLDWSRMYVNARPMSSIVLNHGVKEDIISTVERWRADKDRYTRLGVNYKLGILLSGPPGTGKTSLAKALASYCKIPIYTLNLSSHSDDSFEAALLDVDAGSILLLEDVDCASNATLSRSDTTKSSPIGMTLSGILNALDGVKTADDLIIVLTTNHADRLDPALLRAGRTDLHVKLEALEPSAMSAYSLLVYSMPLEESRCISMKGCDLQAKMLEHPTDHSKFSEAVYDTHIA